MVTIKHKYILYLVFWIALVQGIFQGYLHFSQITYLCDVLLIILLFLYLNEKHEITIDELHKTTLFFLPVAAFILVILIGWMINDTSVASALWGTRNYFRFFLYFALCLAYLDKSDARLMADWLVNLFPLHLLITAFQYIVQNLNGDYLGGIFGTQQGCNGGLVIYLGLLFCIMLIRYESGECSLIRFLIYLLCIFANAAASELKAFYVFAAILALIFLVLSRKKWKSIFIILIIGVVIIIGFQILYYFFPSWSGYFQLSNLTKIFADASSGYSNSEDISRTTVFSRLTPIIRNWNGNQCDLWFGIGLGNADYSTTFKWLNGPFYLQYNRLHYIWLSTACLFIETGYLGLACYTGFFLFIAVRVIRKYCKTGDTVDLMGILITLFCFMLMFYDASLRSNFAYIIFAALSWPFLNSPGEEEGELTEEQQDLND